MWLNGVNFGIIFITSIFLSYQNFVECDINCHKDNVDWCEKISKTFLNVINKYRKKHRAQKLHRFRSSFCNVTLGQAKSLALSGKIMENDPGYNPIHKYSNTFGHVEGIPYENDGENIVQDMVKRWYEEKNNYKDKSYSLEIGNVTRMLWRESRVVTCAICSKDSNTHYVVCAFKVYEPSDNRDPNPKQFNKNVYIK